MFAVASAVGAGEENIFTTNDEKKCDHSTDMLCTHELLSIAGLGEVG